MNKGVTNKGATMIGAAGLGAGLMYLFDPDRGRRRRSFVQDKVVRSVHQTRGAADTTVRDARNRAWGLVASLRSWFRTKPVSDAVLVDRVRAKLGMLVRHPRSIEVTARKGWVTLRGPVLADEVDHLLSIIARIPGVVRLEERLDVHGEAGNVPGLQGSSNQTPRREQFELMQAHWSPTARFLTGAAGSALAIYGARQRTLLGAGLAVAGVGLLARGLTNEELARLMGLRERAGRRANEFQRRGPGGALRERRVRQIKEVMTPQVETIRPDASLEDAAEKMKSLDIGAIPVCDGERLVGMLTDRDIVVRVIAEKRDPKTTAVQDAMTPAVTYCYEDDYVQAAARLMAEEQIRRLAVLNREKRLVGIVSLGDLAVETDEQMTGEVLESVSQPSEPKAT